VKDTLNFCCVHRFNSARNFLPLTCDILPSNVDQDSSTISPAVLMQRFTSNPPISPALQSELDSLSNGVPQPFTAISTPGAGWLIFGDAGISPWENAPECSVATTPFILTFTPAPLGNGQVWGVPTPEYVPAVATISVHNKSSHPLKRYPLLIGAFLPINDPALQWLQSPSVLPNVPAKPGSFVVMIPEAEFRPGYMSNPYPLSLIVCTNGGARFLSLGELQQPIIDPSTHLVTNAVVPTPQPVFGPPPNGPHGPVISNKAP